MKLIIECNAECVFNHNATITEKIEVEIDEDKFCTSDFDKDIPDVEIEKEIDKQVKERFSMKYCYSYNILKVKK